MPKDKKVEGKEPSVPNNFYKGYDMKWLKSEPEHPDYYLVAEYEALKEEK